MPTQQLDFSGMADTGTRIRTAAVHLFASRGYAATSIRDIAKAVGITNAGVYHFVESKEDLLHGLMVHGQELLSSTTRDHLEGVDRPEDRLALLVSGLVGAHGVNRMTSRVTDGELRSFDPASSVYADIVQRRDEYENLWRDTLSRGVEEGVFDLTDRRLTRLALLAMCTGVSEWFREDGDVGLDEVCAEFVNVALTAVNARRDGVAVTVKDVAVVDPTQLARAPYEPRLLDDEGGRA